MLKPKTMIYITGHKNPDMDSLCAAHCYARYKNAIDPENIYEAIRCGALNRQTKYAFALAGVEPPVLLADILPRVQDVVRTNIVTLEENEAIYTAIRKIDEDNISVIPIRNREGTFRGLLSIHEISQYFIAETIGTRPEYLFRPANFGTVLPGRFLHKGKDEEFSTCTMISAMPFETSIRRLEAILPKKPVLLAGLRKDIIRYAIQENFPAIILTGLEPQDRLDIDFSRYAGWVYQSDRDTAETARLLRLSAPVKHIMNADPPRIQKTTLFEEARDALVSSKYRGLPVFDDEEFFGIVTRRCFIDQPKKKLILVDHNEVSHSIPGAENAEIREIIDHHRIGMEKTRHPIYIYAKPVGSTCTLVYQHFAFSGIAITKDIAILLLAGILSDTVALKSPTTTADDETAAAALASSAGLEVRAFSEDLFSQAQDLTKVDPKEVISADIKTYREYGTIFGIGQVEVVTLENFSEAKTALLEALNDIQRRQGLDWAMMLITDVVEEYSLLLVTTNPKKESVLIYRRLEPNLYALPGILSRKKQLLPEILRVLEETRKAPVRANT